MALSDSRSGNGVPADRQPSAVAMTADLAHAIERDEFHLVYQPQFDLETGEIMGVEALLRWNSGQFGAVLPSKFIPLAEKSDLIHTIGRWVLSTACRESAALQARLGLRMGLAVNLSPAQFSEPNLPGLVADVLAQSGLTPQMLELEITEGVFVEDADRALRTLNAIRNMGVSVSIDDFGTGYSSLSYLTRFSVDWIKLDQSFVQQLPEGRNATVLTSAIISIAHNLGMMVIAEGIETREQYDYLLAQGCDLGQGYWLARPMPIAALEQWLTEHTRIPPLPGPSH